MWFSNLKIRSKLLLGFGSCLVLTIGLGLFSYIQLNNIDRDYTNLLDCAVVRAEAMENVATDYAELRLIVASMALQSISGGDSTASEISKLASDFDTELSKANASLTAYLNTLSVDIGLTQEGINERKAGIDNVSSLLNKDYVAIYNKVKSAALNQDHEAALAELTNSSSISDNINNTVSQLVTTASNLKNTVNYETGVSASNSKLILIIFIVVSIILSVVISLVIASLIRKPIQQLVNIANDVADGNLNVNINSAGKDEIGMLSQSFKSVVSTVTGLLYEINYMSEEMQKGDIDARVKVDRFHGDYKRVAETMNSAMTDCINDVMLALSCMTELCNGNFNYQVKNLPGKKVILNKTYDELKNNLTLLSSEINVLISEASAGNLEIVVDDSKYHGGWAAIIQSLNKLINAVSAPIQDVSSALTEVSKANLSVRITNSYSGAFGKMKDALNLTVDNTASYIKDISRILNEIANANLNLRVDRDYIGDFRNIKEAMTTIIEKLNDIIGNINSAASQVSAGARSISESSMTLATGATEQAGSVEELNATIDTINEQTRKNAENALSANTLSENSKKNALAGNDDMKKMLLSMEGIKESSNNISKIIKTIEDIAFQTNLLALNAAVEAARAGEHGKGFAVVAEEVRNLAARSQTAAKETASMIEDSISKVNNGTQIAQLTANSLETIVRDVDEVSTIISNIAESSKEQSSAISQVTIGLGEISNVVQINSTTSEESAAAAQELSSQSETLTNMVSIFSLKTR